MADVTIYSTNNCPYCVRAKDLLTEIGQAYTDIDVSNDPEKRMEVVEKSGGLRTVPQIFINDQHVGGFDDLYKLHTSGELSGLLAD